MSCGHDAFSRPQTPSICKRQKVGLFAHSFSRRETKASCPKHSKEWRHSTKMKKDEVTAKSTHPSTRPSARPTVHPLVRSLVRLSVHPPARTSIRIQRQRCTWKHLHACTSALTYAKKHTRTHTQADSHMRKRVHARNGTSARAHAQPCACRKHSHPCEYALTCI